MKRRHPCEVTGDRIADHMERYWRQLTGTERDHLSYARHLLEEIAENSRSPRERGDE